MRTEACILQALFVHMRTMGCGLQWYHYRKAGEIKRRMIVLLSSCVPKGRVNTRDWHMLLVRCISYLEETLDEVLGESSLGVFLGAEVLEDMSELLPEVEGFLGRHKVNMCILWTSK